MHTDLCILGLYCGGISMTHYKYAYFPILENKISLKEIVFCYLITVLFLIK